MQHTHSADYNSVHSTEGDNMPNICVSISRFFVERFKCAVPIYRSIILTYPKVRIAYTRSVHKFVNDFDRRGSNHSSSYKHQSAIFRCLQITIK